MKLKINGFSLVEVLVAIGIAGAGSMALMQMTKTANKTMKNSETKHEVNVVSTYVHQLLLDKKGCSETLTGTGDLSSKSEVDIAGRTKVASLGMGRT